MMKRHWLYENNEDNTVRYILGTKGKKPLLCFGINPSTAEPDKLDNTLKSVERIALNNGFDSWIMLNIYPQRATDPNAIHKELDTVIHENNLAKINQLLSELPKPVIWAAWGTLIEKRPFLIQCLHDIRTLTSRYTCKWVTIGKHSAKGHPHHPLYLSATAKPLAFNIEGYMNACYIQ